MKYLKGFNSLNESSVRIYSVDKKIELLKDLSLELEDNGLTVDVINGSNTHLLRDPRIAIHTGSRYSDDYKKSIVMYINDDENKFDTDLYNSEIIQEFIETLKSYGMNPRSMSGGRNFCVLKFDKWGSMTNSSYIKESDNYNDIIEDLNDIALDITDDGFILKVDEWSGGGRDFLTCNIYSSLENNEINQDVIDTVTRMIDFMYRKSYNLGKYWMSDGEGKLRLSRKVGNTPYMITLKELDEFINIDFENIEMVFTPLI